MRTRAFVMVSSATIVCGAHAQQVLFEQTPLQDEFYSDASGPVSAQSVADNFVLTSPGVISHVQFWGSYDADVPVVEVFTIDIFTDAGGFPGTLLVSQPLIDIESELSGGVSRERIVTASLPTPFSASAGVSYFVSITANSTSYPAEGPWKWRLGLAPADGAISQDFGATWFPQNGSCFAFRLWNGRPLQDCAADTNNDGLLTPADFNAWIIAFNTNTPECDQNGDGLCTPADFNAWVLNFNAGC